jgi:hypothetical protein
MPSTADTRDCFNLSRRKSMVLLSHTGYLLNDPLIPRDSLLQVTAQLDIVSFFVS